VRLFINRFDEHHQLKTRQLHYIVPILLPALLQAFTCEEAGIHGREHILNLFHLLIRLITWADGIDNELVEKCLGDHFHSWMALFLQILQSKKRYFNVKKNALKCLTVIFRDLINFSKESINMILKPSWKLLNSHLPVFTEVVAYNNPMPLSDDGSDEETADVGNESFDEEEHYGVEGMTFHLLELLSTLVLRPNVQQLVLQGLVPLLSSVSSYLLIQHEHEREYLGDPTYFVVDKSQDLLKV
jgi:importin-9